MSIPLRLWHMVRGEPATRARGCNLGYELGALAAGIIADRFGLTAAILGIEGLTFVSGAIVAVAMREPKRPGAAQ